MGMCFICAEHQCVICDLFKQAEMNPAKALAAVKTCETLLMHASLAYHAKVTSGVKI